MRHTIRSASGVRMAACAAAIALGVWAAQDGSPVIASGAASGTAMVRIPAGRYAPLYSTPTSGREGSGVRPRTSAVVAAFKMDAHAVTNAAYLEFVRAHPEWRRSRVAALFADASYLRHWRGDLDLGEQAPPASPVVYVSWFAARAYLKSAGKALPTVDQWEYVASASETQRDASRNRAFLDRLRVWYGRPARAPLPPADSGVRNVYGVSGLHGLVWEWTLDFNSALVTGESRADSALERTLYCGSGAAGASDFEDYAAFMRYAFRSSLDARYAVGTLGFRGVVNGARPTR